MKLRAIRRQDRPLLRTFIVCISAMVASIVGLAPVHADQPLKISHRIGFYTPSRPNELTLEFVVVNAMHQNLQNIRLQLTNSDISPGQSAMDLPGVLLATDSTRAYWTLETPVSRDYLANGNPIFIRGTAHSAANESIEFSIVSTLKGE